MMIYFKSKQKLTLDPPLLPEHFETMSEDIYQGDCEGDCEGDYQSVNCKSNLIIGFKPKVLIISCYGYGNMGDNMYSEVFTRFLPECDIVKVSDHSMFVNDNKQFSTNVPSNPSKNWPFDFLIIGGGGLLTAKKLKDSINMPYYINLAKKRAKPLFIISCGLQGYMNDFQNTFGLWKDVLNYAKVITVRSKKDKELLGTLVNPKR